MAKATYSRATIAGHPVHVMLVSFPIAFYTAGLVSLILYSGSGSAFQYRLSYVAFLAGAAMAVLAAVFGMFDFSGVPRGTPARRSGWIHAALNIPSTVLFAAAGAMLYFGDTGRVPLVLASVAFVATGAAGWFGWKLVQTHHVGVDDRPKAQREPSASARPVEHGMVGR